MRERQEKAYGPYGPHGGRYRVIIEYPDGSREYARESEDGPAGFASWEAAAAYKDAYNGEASGHSIAAAADLYLEHCRTRELKSVRTIGFRLKALLQTVEHPDRLLRQLRPAVARELFAGARKENQRGYASRRAQRRAPCVRVVARAGLDRRRSIRRHPSHQAAEPGAAQAAAPD